jgi:hypothetical protein
MDQWCQQSFLSTENYKDAMEGLMYVRDYRSGTSWFRAAARFISRFTFDPLESLGVNMGLIKSRQKTLLWTKESRSRPKQVQHPETQASEATPPRRPPQHVQSPSIELTDYSTVANDGSAVVDTPAMAHSVFPFALTPHRPRNASDASIHEPVLPIFERFRRSDDSSRPLVTALSDIHRSRASSTHHNRRGSEYADPRSSSEYALSPSSPYGEPIGYGERLDVDTSTLQIRQGYRRKNSEPDSPPLDVAIAGAVSEHDALGISIAR